MKILIASLFVCASLCGQNTNLLTITPAPDGSTTGELRWREAVNSGAANYFGISAQSSIPATVRLELQLAAPSVGDCLAAGALTAGKYPITFQPCGVSLLPLDNTWTGSNTFENIVTINNHDLSLNAGSIYAFGGGGDQILKTNRVVMNYLGGTSNYQFLMTTTNVLDLLDNSGNLMARWDSGLGRVALAGDVFGVGSTLTRQLGLSLARWKKLWVGDIDVSGTCTGCGTSLLGTDNTWTGTNTWNSVATFQAPILIPGSTGPAMARPAITTTRITGEINGTTSSPSSDGDEGFLRLSAGGRSVAALRSYIDLSGYSGVPDLDRNIAFGANGAERLRINGASSYQTLQTSGGVYAVLGFTSDQGLYLASFGPSSTPNNPGGGYGGIGHRTGSTYWYWNGSAYASVDFAATTPNLLISNNTWTGTNAFGAISVSSCSGCPVGASLSANNTWTGTNAFNNIVTINNNDLTVNAGSIYAFGAGGNQILKTNKVVMNYLGGASSYQFLMTTTNILDLLDNSGNLMARWDSGLGRVALAGDVFGVGSTLTRQLGLSLARWSKLWVGDIDSSGGITTGAITTGTTNPSSVYIGTTGNFYMRRFSGGDVSCGGIIDGWAGIRTDTSELQVCIGGVRKKVSLL